MPVVTFYRIFIHARADLDDWRDYWVRDGAPVFRVDAAREVYGAGNTGVVRSPRATDDATYDLVDIPRADEEWFRDHAGQTMLIRDPRGAGPRGRMWGFWNELALAELPGMGDYFDLPLAVQMVTAPDPVEVEA